MANNLPSPGRFAHYVSKKEPFVESPALITGIGADWLGMLDSAKEMAPVTLLGESMADALGEGYSSDRHVSLQVFGLVNVYPEWNIPYFGPVPARGEAPRPEGSFKTPGTWHWWDECGDYNDHISTPVPEED